MLTMAMTSHILLSIAIVTLMSAYPGVDAHLCLLSPPQRGSQEGINKAGAADCGLTTGQCGGRDPAAPVVGIKSGASFRVTFQKNLDHYTSTGQGYFTIGLGMMNLSRHVNATIGEIKILKQIPDDASPSLHLYSTEVSIPKNLMIRTYDEKVGLYLQMTYVTKNKMAPPVFYQCADVTLL